MTTFGSGTILSVFVLFCRIGACLMLMPGFSSDRVPVQMRLFLTLAVTLALAPVLVAKVEPNLSDMSLPVVARLVISETLVGGLIGLLGRFFFLALETLTNAMAMAVGLGSFIATGIENSELAPQLVSFITLAATMLFFATDQHWEVLRAIADSYAALPVANGFGVQFSLVQLADIASRTFFLTLRLASPFMIFGIVINLAIGLANKLTPQIPVYFISMPFVLTGGLFLLYFVSKQFLQSFMSSFAAWLSTG
ncbi:MAG: flagellar biosynthesis protein FliR [Hyphomicrobiales bacterium]